MRMENEYFGYFHEIQPTFDQIRLKNSPIQDFFSTRTPARPNIRTRIWGQIYIHPVPGKRTRSKSYRALYDSLVNIYIEWVVINALQRGFSRNTMCYRVLYWKTISGSQPYMSIPTSWPPPLTLPDLTVLLCSRNMSPVHNNSLVVSCVWYSWLPNTYSSILIIG